MDDLTALYCLMDDFCKKHEAALNQRLLAEGKIKRVRPTGLSLAELMTLVVHFHQLRYRQFKAFYLHHVSVHLRAAFPTLPSYNRCVELLPRCAHALGALFETIKGKCSGLSIVDSTPIAVCDNLRIKRHRVFRDYAARGKSSTGWFFGFKLHAVINHLGELLAIKFTPGNVDDRNPVLALTHSLSGKLYADKGYLSKKLTQTLKEKSIELITKVRKNMKTVIYSAFDQAVLQHRSLIETVFDQLKNLCQIEHTRHRSPANFIVNCMAAIVTYCLQPNKPQMSSIRTHASSYPLSFIPN